MPEIFEENDYRRVIRLSLAEKKQKSGQRYSMARLASACRVQSTYLSRVLNGSGDLSEDQVYLACRFLNFSDVECEITEILRRLKHCQIPSRRKTLEEELHKAQRKILHTEHKISVQMNKTAQPDFHAYYYDPMTAVVHVALSIEKFSHHPLTLAKYLGIPENTLQSHFKLLEQLGYVAIAEKGIELIVPDVHLSQNSPMFPLYKRLVRMTMLHRIERHLEDKNSYNLNVFFAADEKCRCDIHKLFLDFLEKAKKMSDRAKKDCVYQLTFDLMECGQ